MREAAGTLEEASALYGYREPIFASWTAEDLRREAEHVENTTPTPLYDVNCAGHAGGDSD
jgi:hypothetical protein